MQRSENTRYRSIVVPANLLLFGEYAILEPGGLALSCAVEPLLRAWSSPAKRPCCSGIMAGQKVMPETDGRIFQAVLQVFRESGISLEGTHITVDSSRFFSTSRMEAAREEQCAGDVRTVRGEQNRQGAEGERTETGTIRRQKIGLGSSAAVTLAIVALLLAAGGIDALREQNKLSYLAAKAHRYAQGGGSGYDVQTSMRGSFNFLIGGTYPYCYYREPFFRYLSLLSTEHSVSSSGAGLRYRDWKYRNPKAARDFLFLSNAIVGRVIKAKEEHELEGLFAEARSLARNLGREIGVPAEEKEQIGQGGEATRGKLWKFSGAGNELLVICNAGSKEKRLRLHPGAQWI